MKLFLMLLLAIRPKLLCLCTLHMHNLGAYSWTFGDDWCSIPAERGEYLYQHHNKWQHSHVGDIIVCHLVTAMTSNMEWKLYVCAVYGSSTPLCRLFRGSDMLPRLKFILKAIEPPPSCPQSRQQVTPYVSKQEHVFLVQDLSKTSAVAPWGSNGLSKSI